MNFENITVKQVLEAFGKYHYDNFKAENTYFFKDKADTPMYCYKKFIELRAFLKKQDKQSLFFKLPLIGIFGQDQLIYELIMLQPKKTEFDKIMLKGLEEAYCCSEECHKQFLKEEAEANLKNN